MFTAYYHLTKPRIIYGNLITASAGFLLASRSFPADWPLLGWTLVGLSFAIASGCVLNNYIDREIDAKMERTKNRSLVTGEVSIKGALIYAAVLFVAGFAALAVYVNLWALGAVGVGFFFYIVMYSFWKRRGVSGVMWGSVAGAVPPVAGYLAASPFFDLGAGVLFLTFVLWQMPHFYAISIYRADEYRAAGIPLLPEKMGLAATKLTILAYITAFTASAALLYYFGYAGIPYLIITAVASLAWFGYGASGFKEGTNDRRWARKMFFVSLAVLMSLSAALIIDYFFSVAAQ